MHQHAFVATTKALIVIDVIVLHSNCSFCNLTIVVVPAIFGRRRPRPSAPTDRPSQVAIHPGFPPRRGRAFGADEEPRAEPRNYRPANAIAHTLQETGVPAESGLANLAISRKA